MSNKKIKLQHYVPQFYLKNFAVKSKNNHLLFCYDKEEKRVFQTDVSNIACEKYFYDEDIDKEQKLEKDLASLEGLFSKSLQDLIECRDLTKLSVNTRFIISLFISIQLLRSKEERISIENAIQGLDQKLAGQKLGEELKRNLERAKTKEWIKSMHIDILKSSSKEIAGIFFQMKWILTLNKCGCPFWTSDNPVALHNELQDNLGLTAKGTEIHFPISPFLSLTIYDPRVFSRMPDKEVTKDFRRIIRERDLQVRYSTRFVFSPKDKFDFARMMINKEPVLGNPDRKRLKVN